MLLPACLSLFSRLYHGQLHNTMCHHPHLLTRGPRSCFLSLLTDLTGFAQMDKETAADDAAERDARRLYAKSANGRSVGGASRRANKAAQKAASGAGRYVTLVPGSSDARLPESTTCIPPKSAIVLMLVLMLVLCWFDLIQ